MSYRRVKSYECLYVCLFCVFRKITTRIMSARMLNERRVNEDIPRQVQQVDQVLPADQSVAVVQVPIGGEGNEVPVVSGK